MSKAESSGEDVLTIEQLAHRSGMSVRNIRNHQTRGLLPPPEVRARTGYYGQRHVERLRLIQRMQGEGIKLSGIQRLLAGESDWAERFAAMRETVAAPFEVEPPEVMSLAELEEMFGPASRNGRVLAKAQKLGVLVDVGEDRYEVPSPSLLRAAEEAMSHGISLAAAMAVIEKVQRNAESSAASFVKLFTTELGKSLDSDDPDTRWQEMTEAIESLRSVSVEVLVALFKQALAAETDKAFSRTLEEQARRR